MDPPRLPPVEVSVGMIGPRALTEQLEERDEGSGLRDVCDEVIGVHLGLSGHYDMLQCRHLRAEERQLTDAIHHNQPGTKTSNDLPRLISPCSEREEVGSRTHLKPSNLGIRRIGVKSVQQSRANRADSRSRDEGPLETASFLNDDRADEGKYCHTDGVGEAEQVS